MHNILFVATDHMRRQFKEIYDRYYILNSILHGNKKLQKNYPIKRAIKNL